MNFLSAFKTILHALEAAASIAAPIVAIVDPVIGSLMIQATNAAVGVESVITDPGTGAQKAELVRAQTQATVDVANAILASQNKKPLPSNVTDIVQSQVAVVVAGLKSVAQAVGPVTPVPVAPAVSARLG